ncbi:hypothetical protein [Pseudomonas sp. Leaf48]|jgi:hypothetical protein|uniref:hypothetical protein n=1 Tax=Pseudomonas sp. Leaf48 TaxID=1736221 RepID=UPI001F31EB1B|nr:hypothetical protein [Pseudomonas sp. Leaf48]
MMPADAMFELHGSSKTASPGGSGENTNLRAIMPMMCRVLAALTLVVLPFHSMAHNEHSIGSTEIEFYEIELSPNEKLKMSHLKIYSENELHDDEGVVDDDLPLPPQNTADENDFSFIAL